MKNRSPYFESLYLRIKYCKAGRLSNLCDVSSAYSYVSSESEWLWCPRVTQLLSQSHSHTYSYRTVHTQNTRRYSLNRIRTYTSTYIHTQTLPLSRAPSSDLQREGMRLRVRASMTNEGTWELSRVTSRAFIFPRPSFALLLLLFELRFFFTSSLSLCQLSLFLIVSYSTVWKPRNTCGRTFSRVSCPLNFSTK